MSAGPTDAVAQAGRGGQSPLGTGHYPPRDSPGLIPMPPLDESQIVALRDDSSIKHDQTPGLSGFQGSPELDASTPLVAYSDAYDYRMYPHGSQDSRSHDTVVRDASSNFVGMHACLLGHRYCYAPFDVILDCRHICEPYRAHDALLGVVILDLCIDRYEIRWRSAIGSADISCDCAVGRDAKRWRIHEAPCVIRRRAGLGGGA